MFVLVQQSLVEIHAKIKVLFLMYDNGMYHENIGVDPIPKYFYFIVNILVVQCITSDCYCRRDQ